MSKPAFDEEALFHAARRIDAGEARDLFLQQACGADAALAARVRNAGGIVKNLIGCLERLRQYDEAETWRRKWLAVVKERAGADSIPYAGELAMLGLNLLQQKKWPEAETTLKECLAIRRKQQPDAWSTFNAQSSLGGALLGRKMYAEAEPLLLEGYEGMKARAKTIPPQGEIRLTEALDRLIELYIALNKPEEAEKFRAERAKYPDATQGESKN